MKDKYYLLYDLFGLYIELIELRQDNWYNPHNEFYKMEEREILNAIKLQEKEKGWM